MCISIEGGKTPCTVKCISIEGERHPALWNVCISIEGGKTPCTVKCVYQYWGGKDTLHCEMCVSVCRGQKTPCTVKCVYQYWGGKDTLHCQMCVSVLRGERHPALSNISVLRGERHPALWNVCISIEGGKTPCTVKCVYQYWGGKDTLHCEMCVSVLRGERHPALWNVCISIEGGKTPCTVKCVYQYWGGKDTLHCQMYQYWGGKDTLHCEMYQYWGEKDTLHCQMYQYWGGKDTLYCEMYQYWGGKDTLHCEMCVSVLRGERHPALSNVSVCRGQKTHRTVKCVSVYQYWGGKDTLHCEMCVSVCRGQKTHRTVKCVYQYAGRMLLALALWKPPKYFLSGINCGSIPNWKPKCMFCFAVYHTRMTAKIQIQHWSQKYCWRKVLFHFHWQQTWRRQQGLEKKTTMDSTHPVQYSVFLQCAIRLNCRLRRTWQCKQRCVGKWTYFSSSSDTTQQAIKIDGESLDFFLYVHWSVKSASPHTCEDSTQTWTDQKHPQKDKPCVVMATNRPINDQSIQENHAVCSYIKVLLHLQWKWRWGIVREGQKRDRVWTKKRNAGKNVTYHLRESNSKRVFPEYTDACTSSMWVRSQMMCHADCHLTLHPPRPLPSPTLDMTPHFTSSQNRMGICIGSWTTLPFPAPALASPPPHKKMWKVKYQLACPSTDEHSYKITHFTNLSTTHLSPHPHPAAQTKSKQFHFCFFLPLAFFFFFHHKKRETKTVKRWMVSG